VGAETHWSKIAIAHFSDRAAEWMEGENTRMADFAPAKRVGLSKHDLLLLSEIDKAA
jgi:hypothetical protein